MPQRSGFSREVLGEAIWMYGLGTGMFGKPLDLRASSRYECSPGHGARMSITNPRARSFLRRLLTVLAIIVAVVGALVLANHYTGFLNPALAQAVVWLEAGNDFLDQPLMRGVSVGVIVISLATLFLPLMMKGINRSQYLTAVRRGIVGTVVFFLSQQLYVYASSFGRAYLILAMVGVLIVTLIMVEVLSRFKHQEEEAAFRTDLAAGLSTGLVCALVFQAIESLLK